MRVVSLFLGLLLLGGVADAAPRERAIVLPAAITSAVPDKPLRAYLGGAESIARRQDAWFAANPAVARELNLALDGAALAALEKHEAVKQGQADFGALRLLRAQHDVRSFSGKASTVYTYITLAFDLLRPPGVGEDADNAMELGYTRAMVLVSHHAEEGGSVSSARLRELYGKAFDEALAGLFERVVVDYRAGALDRETFRIDGPTAVALAYLRTDRAEALKPIVTASAREAGVSEKQERERIDGELLQLIQDALQSAIVDGRAPALREDVALVPAAFPWTPEEWRYYQERLGGGDTYPEPPRIKAIIDYDAYDRALSAGEQPDGIAGYRAEFAVASLKQAIAAESEFETGYALTGALAGQVAFLTGGERHAAPFEWDKKRKRAIGTGSVTFAYAKGDVRRSANRYDAYRALTKSIDAMAPKLVEIINAVPATLDAAAEFL